METNKKGRIASIASYYFKEKLLTSIIVGVLGIAGGIGAGIVIDKYFIGEISTDYSGMDADSYMVDMDKLMSKYNNAGALSDYTTSFSDYEIINIGFGLYTQHESTRSFTFGAVDAGPVKQSVRSCSIKSNGKYFDESISASSLVQVATRNYQHDGAVDLYRGQGTSAETATWNPDNLESFSEAEFEELYGKTPSKPLIFIISSKTVVSSTIERVGTDYKVSVELKKKSAVLNYIRQMKNISGLDEYPSFSELSAEFTFDKNLLIKKMVTHETYFARTSGIGATCSGTVEVTYSVDGDYVIPTLNENVNYDEGRN